MSNLTEYKEIRAFHPGYFVKQIIEDMGITQEEFAQRLGTTGKNISELVNGRCLLSRELAMQLSNMTGMSLETWMNLRMTYERKMLEIEERKQMDEEQDILKMLEYRFFVVNASLPVTKDKSTMVRKLKELLGIASLSALLNKELFVVYRMHEAENSEKNLVPAKAWLLLAQKIAMQTMDQQRPPDIEKLKSYIPTIRSMTKRDVLEILPELKRIFNDCAIALVCLPAIKNSKVCGCVKWLKSGKSVFLAISDRTKSQDVFWLTLMHEIWHLLQRDYSRAFVSFEDTSDISDVEKEADDFARNTLVDRKIFQKLVRRGKYNDEDIISAALEADVDKGIIAGRLAKEQLVRFSRIAHLRRQFSFATKDDEAQAPQQ